MKSLHQPKIRYKGVTLQQFIDLLINNYQATLEKQADAKKLIKVQCDPNQHIEILFDRLRTHLQTLAEMKNTIPYPPEKSLEIGYITRKNIGLISTFVSLGLYWYNPKNNYF